MFKSKFVFRPAFSMLELVFVIVILGIVSGIGAEVIAKVYENYIIQRALHRTSVKTELAAAQIANRLAYAIPNTVIARLDATSFTAIENAPKANKILEWVAYDADSFGYTGQPGWSGFADVRAGTTNLNQISTPGSNLSFTNIIIGKLSAVTSPKTINDAAVFFSDPSIYDVHTVGFKESTIPTPTISTVNAWAANAIIPFDAPLGSSSRTVKEHYKLAWTAYAIVPTELTAAQYLARDLGGLSANDKLYDLVLHYNFQPWDDSYYDAAPTKTLIRNVSVFNFMGTGDTIRFKLCTQESIGGTYPITVCKEKAVIR